MKEKNKVKRIIKKVSTRDCGGATAIGDCGRAAAIGDYGGAMALGRYSHASASGNSGIATASGYYSRASSSGNSGRATAISDYSRASSIGDYSYASAIGKFGVAIAGRDGTAKADASGCVAVIYWDMGAQRPRIAVGYVGENGIKAGTWYCVKNGILKEVE